MSENKSTDAQHTFYTGRAGTLQRIADERSCSVGAAVRAAVKAQYIEPTGAKRMKGTPMFLEGSRRTLPCPVVAIH